MILFSNHKHTRWSQQKMSQVYSDFLGKLRTLLPNKAQKRVNITGVQYFPGLWSWLWSYQQECCQLHLLFTLSLFKFLTNCTNFPFSPPPHFGAFRLFCGLSPLHFDKICLLHGGLSLCFNHAASEAIRASSAAAWLSALTRPASALDRLSASILAAKYY